MSYITYIISKKFVSPISEKLRNRHWKAEFNYKYDISGGFKVWIIEILAILLFIGMGLTCGFGKDGSVRNLIAFILVTGIILCMIISSVFISDESRYPIQKKIIYLTDIAIVLLVIALNWDAIVRSW